MLKGLQTNCVEAPCFYYLNLNRRDAVYILSDVRDVNDRLGASVLDNDQRGSLLDIIFLAKLTVLFSENLFVLDSCLIKESGSKTAVRAGLGCNEKYLLRLAYLGRLTAAAIPAASMWAYR